jgi:hypothetical protein
VGRLILLQDRESVSNCNFVWRDLVFLWCTGSEGCPSDLVIKSGGPITFDSRSGVSSLAQVLGFGLFMVSFGGSEVERWWKLNGLSVRSFSIVAQLWCSGRGVYFLGWFFFGGE